MPNFRIEVDNRTKQSILLADCSDLENEIDAVILPNDSKLIKSLSLSYNTIVCFNEDTACAVHYDSIDKKWTVDTDADVEKFNYLCFEFGTSGFIVNDSVQWMRDCELSDIDFSSLSLDDNYLIDEDNVSEISDTPSAVADDLELVEDNTTGESDDHFSDDDQLDGKDEVDEYHPSSYKDAVKEHEEVFNNDCEIELDDVPDDYHFDSDEFDGDDYDLTLEDVPLSVKSTTFSLFKGNVSWMNARIQKAPPSISKVMGAKTASQLLSIAKKRPYVDLVKAVNKIYTVGKQMGSNNFRDGAGKFNGGVCMNLQHVLKLKDGKKVKLPVMIVDNLTSFHGLPVTGQKMGGNSTTLTVKEFKEFKKWSDKNPATLALCQPSIEFLRKVITEKVRYVIIAIGVAEDKTYVEVAKKLRKWTEDIKLSGHTTDIDYSKYVLDSMNSLSRRGWTKEQSKQAGAGNNFIADAIDLGIRYPTAVSIIPSERLDPKFGNKSDSAGSGDV